MLNGGGRSEEELGTQSLLCTVAQGSPDASVSFGTTGQTVLCLH